MIKIVEKIVEIAVIEKVPREIVVEVPRIIEEIVEVDQPYEVYIDRPFLDKREIFENRYSELQNIRDKYKILLDAHQEKEKLFREDTRRLREYEQQNKHFIRNEKTLKMNEINKLENVSDSNEQTIRSFQDKQNQLYAELERLVQ